MNVTVSNPFLASIARRPIVVHHIGDRLIVTERDTPQLSLRLDQRVAPCLTVESRSKGAAMDSVLPLMAAVEMLSSMNQEADRVILDAASFSSMAGVLTENGVAVRERDGGLAVHAAMVWQQPEPWMAGIALPPFPLRLVLSQGRRHPQRPPKPDGLFYTRFIPWLGKPISFRVATARDGNTLSEWFNNPRVNAVWGLAGTREQHDAYLAAVMADPHKLPLIASFGDDAFGYFEVYWAKEDRLAPFYDADDYDRGWHVLIGEERFRGKPYVSAWLPSLMHALFLDDPRTFRVVGEPAADHKQQIRNLQRSGFAALKTFSFPNKRAVLVMLLKERFFEDHLWRPAQEAV